jgi:capsular exopolysaccharide synthesis family protein
MTEPATMKLYPNATIRDFYYVLFRQKRKIILFFCTVVVAVTLGTFLSPKTYQSEAMLLVRLGRENVSIDPTAATGQTVNLSQNRENEIKSEMEILTSQSLAEMVVDTIGYKAFLSRNPDPLLKIESAQRADHGFAPGSPSAPPSPSRDLKPSTDEIERDKAIRKFKQNLTVDFQKNSSILTIQYDASGRHLSQLVVAKLTDFYLDKHINVHRTPGSEKFFVTQTKELRAKLEQSEDALRKLKNQTGIASVAEQRNILVNRIGALQRSLEETEAALAGSRNRVQTMQTTLSGLPKTLIRTKISGYSGNPIDYIQQRLHDLQLKEQDLLSNFTEKNQQVQEVRREIAEVRGLLNKEGATHAQVTQLATLTEKATVSELQGKAKALKEELAQAKSELQVLNDNEMRITQLEREIDIQKGNYRNYSEKLEQTRIDRALEVGKISNISIVQPATYPVKPIRPRKALNLALGLFLGAFGGLAIAFLSEHLDHSFKAPDDVDKYLDLPVLMTIPLWGGKTTPKVGDTDEYFGLSLRRGGGQEVPSVTRKYFEALIDRIFLSVGEAGKAPQIIAVSSCLSGEGVSSVAVNLAVNLGYNGGRILLVDANINRPSVHKIFRVNQSPGLAEMFKHGQLNQNLIQPTPVKNLDVLTSGVGPVNLMLLFESKAFTDQLALWRREYQYVIFDLPPLNESPHTTRLIRLVDGVILVVEAERTRWEVAQQAKEMFVQDRANVLGVVLNKRQFPIPAWLYRTI